MKTKFKYLNDNYIIDNLSTTSTYLKDAIIDGYKRLLFPSIEREVRNNLTKRKNDAIDVFSMNLNHYLCKLL